MHPNKEATCSREDPVQPKVNKELPVRWREITVLIDCVIQCAGASCVFRCHFVSLQPCKVVIRERYSADKATCGSEK